MGLHTVKKECKDYRTQQQDGVRQKDANIEPGRVLAL